MSGLAIYPIKSGAGIPVESGDLDRHGMRHDRSFMVVDADGRYMTQREYPTLALIRPQLVGTDLAVQVGDVGSVTIALEATGPRTTVTVWEHTGPAIDAGDEAADLISDHLDKAVRLVGIPPDHERAVDTAYAPPGHSVGFSDAYQLLIVGESSLTDLNSRLSEPLPMDRFRPNIVIEGAPAFAEDGWRRIRIGDVEIDLVKPCARCAITTVDQTTGVRDGAEPLRTLGTFRRGDRGVLFGQNGVYRRAGRLAVGDRIEVMDHTSG